MFIRTSSDLTKHPKLRQAIGLSILQTKKVWKSIYMDSKGELAITFNGKLTESQIKVILTHFKDLIDGDTNVENISTEYGVDYMYSQDGSMIDIYTPDGYDYSNF